MSARLDDRGTIAVRTPAGEGDLARPCAAAHVPRRGAGITALHVTIADPVRPGH